MKRIALITLVAVLVLSFSATVFAAGANGHDNGINRRHYSAVFAGNSVVFESSTTGHRGTGICPYNEDCPYNGECSNNGIPPRDGTGHKHGRK